MSDSQRVGVNIHSTGNTPLSAVLAELDGARELGVGVVRLNESWSELEPSAGVYRFDAAISLQREIAARGLRAVMIVGTTPRWCQMAGVSNPYSKPPADSIAWEAFMAAYCQVVKPWALEVFNEPANTGNMSMYPAQYAELLGRAYRASRGTGVLVATGGLTSTPTTTFNQAILSNQAWPAARNCDVWSIHQYPITQNGARARLSAWRAELTKRGAPTTLPLWVTEAGISADHSLQSSTRYVGEPGQASYVSEVFLDLLTHGAALACWYEHQDWSGDTSKFRLHGLRAADGRKRPAWNTLHTALGGI